MEIFLSYARPDRQRADSIALRLRQAGNDVWLDDDLTGGQIWWDGILRQLRRCDATVTIVSRASLRSQACIRERQYAARLGKPVLPVAIEPIDTELLPTELARLQVIDYSQPGEEAAYQLAGAVFGLPRPRALPDPLPGPPPVPTSPLDTVAGQLSGPSLTQDQHLAIIGRLESALEPSADPNDRPVALDLLNRMAQRPDLLAAVDKRIRTLRASTQDSQTPRASQWTPGPQPTSGGPGGADFPRSGTQRGSGVRQQTGDLRQQAPAAANVSPHWVMAIVALICFFPLGIPAVIYASRTRTSLEAGELERARAAASRVKIFFWITIALCVIAALSASHG